MPLLQATPLIPLLPLGGFVVLVLAGRRMGRAAGWFATAIVALSFVATAVVFAGTLAQPDAHRSYSETLFSWLPVSGLHVSIGFLADPLSLTMALFVTGVAALIHLYSIGYMHEDENYPTFFVYMNLFVASMLVLAMADNLVLTFLGWEGVGACSYWLIAFWYQRDIAASAGKKAFIYNRIGDFGFLVAMFLLFGATGTLNYTGIFAAAHLGHIAGTTATAVVLLMFLAATGKSAQIPLFPWLVDAMEGPTPVSALIHAATMVTAGVYLLTRLAPILALSPVSGTVIAWIGVATAFVAATAACAQTDIKKVLAYSTISQLGYMFLAVGTGDYVAAIFLMVTHAFYKALLFLGAGSVIHGLHDEQDIKRMGALRRFMPLTAVTFLVAWLAIGGVPPFAGFWSKGEVLFGAYAVSPALWAVGALTAVLTAYYIGREYYLVFHGTERWRELGVMGDGAHGAVPHESPAVMAVPLVVLAVLSFLGGFVDLPFHPRWVFLERWLGPVVGTYVRPVALGAGFHVGLAVVDGVLALLGVTFAAAAWLNRTESRVLEPVALFKGWYLDTAYDVLVARTSTALSGMLAYFVELRVIDAAVNGFGLLFRRLGGTLRRVQTGYVRNYALGIVLGAVALMAWLLSRVGV